MTWWIWLLVGLLFLLVELITPGGFYMLFFGAAALLIGALTGLGLAGPGWMQWLLFSIIGVLSLVFFRGPLIARARLRSADHDVDSLVGETAVAMSDIAADGIGKAELRGTSWAARNVGSSIVLSGQRCKVENVDGLMLWIRG
ncbi:MAG TPA: NfeD family protein [Beijerinckiaceae bacterium]|nr:NfeD family protein [Beijerinckiaceae bacterium]